MNCADQAVLLFYKCNTHVLYSMTETKKSKQAFEAAITEYVAPRLSEMSYRRYKQSFFWKWNSGCFWRVWPFLRETRGVDEAFLHITACIGFPELTRFLASWAQMPSNVDMSKPCNMAADIIYLRPSVQNPTRISPDTDPDRLGIFIWQDIKTFMIPFLEQVGTFEKAIESWEKGKFYNAAGMGTYLLAAAYFLRGDKSRALNLVRAKIAGEEEQVRSGSAPLTTLNAAEMDLVSGMDLKFDLMANQSLEQLRSFESFLAKQEPPAIPPL